MEEPPSSSSMNQTMSRIAHLINSDSSFDDSDSFSAPQPPLTPPPVLHRPSYSSTNRFDTFNEDAYNLPDYHKELAKTISSKQFQNTTLNRMARCTNKTQEKVMRLRKDKEAKEVQENKAVPTISENSKKTTTQAGTLYERALKQTEEKKKELDDKKAKAIAAKAALENPELTFKPKTKALKTQVKRDAEEVNKALYAWQKEREAKVKLKQELKRKQEASAATFKPELTQRTTKLATRKHKDKKRVDLRLYESTKNHAKVLEKSHMKYDPKFMPNLSYTQGHRMKKKLDKDVFSRLYNSTTDLAEILHSYNSQRVITPPQSSTPKAYRSPGELTSTGLLLREVMPASRMPNESPRPLTDRPVRRQKKKVAVVDLKYFQGSSLSTTSSDVMKSLFTKTLTPSSSEEDETYVPIQEQQSEDDEPVNLGGSFGDVDSLLASLSNLTKLPKKA